MRTHTAGKQPQRPSRPELGAAQPNTPRRSNRAATGKPSGSGPNRLGTALWVLLLVLGLTGFGRASQAPARVAAAGPTDEPERIAAATSSASSELTGYNRLARFLADGVYGPDGELQRGNGFWESAGIGFSGRPQEDDLSPTVTFDLGETYSVSRIRIWNFPEGEVAVKKIRIETSVDGATFQALKEVDNVRQEASPDTDIGLETPVARYVRLVVLENWGGTVYPVKPGADPKGFHGFAGLHEVAMYGIPGPVSVIPTITGQPSNISVQAGQPAAFTAAASGTPAPQLRWQRSTDAGASWADLAEGDGITGAAGESLLIAPSTEAMNGHQFRLVASNSAGAATSTAAVLTVTPAPVAPTITLQPANASVNAGQNATFVAAADGVPAPTVIWQRSTDSGASWADLAEGNGISGSASGSLGIAGATLAMNGHQFRLVASNSAGSATSQPAVLAVNTTTQVVSDYLEWYRADSPQFDSLADGQAITNWLPEPGSSAAPVTVQVPGKEIVYRKAVAGLNGQPALEFPGGASTIKEIGNVNFNGVSLFLVFKNIGTGGIQRAVTGQDSNTLLGPWHPSQGGRYNPTIHLNGVWKIHPQDVVGWVDPSICVLSVVIDNVATEKSFINGEKIENSSPGPMETAGIGRLAFNAAGGQFAEELYKGYISEFIIYRRVLSAAEIDKVHGYLLSKYGLGNLPGTPTITLQPSNVSVNAGQNATFTAGASGAPAPSLIWQRSINGGAAWSDLEEGNGFAGTRTGTLGVTEALAGMNGHLFRLLASNGAGSAASSAAILRVFKPSGPPELIRGVTATATSELDGGFWHRVASHAVDGVYCDGFFWESAGVGFRSFNSTDDPAPAITFDLQESATVDHFVIWNSHEPDPAIKRMVVLGSQDGVGFTSLGEFALEPGNGCPPTPQTILLGGALARYIRFQMLENWAGTVFPIMGVPTTWPHVAIDEVEFYANSGRPPLLVPPVREAEGWVIRFTGAGDSLVELQRASDPRGPWTAVGTLMPVLGEGRFKEPHSGTEAVFYRLKSN